MPQPRKRYLFLAAPPFIIHYRKYLGDIYTLSGDVIAFYKITKIVRAL